MGLNKSYQLIYVPLLKPDDYSWHFLPHPHHLLLIDNLTLIRRHQNSMAGTLHASLSAVIYLAAAGAKHTSFDSCPPVEPKTSKGTKDNQGEGTSRHPRGVKRKIQEDSGKW